MVGKAASLLETGRLAVSALSLEGIGKERASRFFWSVDALQSWIDQCMAGNIGVVPPVGVDNEVDLVGSIAPLFVKSYHVDVAVSVGGCDGNDDDSSNIPDSFVGVADFVCDDDEDSPDSFFDVTDFVCDDDKDLPDSFFDVNNDNDLGVKVALLPI